MVQEKSFRRTNLRWSQAEFDRLLRAVKLEDVTPPVDRFSAIASLLERTPGSVRSKWLEARDAALRGKSAESPAAVAFVHRRSPASEPEETDDQSLDALIGAYRQAQRRADALLERVFALAGQDSEALAGLRQTLFGRALPATPATPAEAHQEPLDEGEGRIRPSFRSSTSRRPEEASLVR